MNANGTTPAWSRASGAEEGMETVDLLCSRNARPQKALVGRAHVETDPGHSRSPDNR
jgi:hypothetical protein